MCIFLNLVDMHNPGSNIPIEVLLLRSAMDMSNTFTNYFLHMLALYLLLISLLQDFMGMILCMFSNGKLPQLIFFLEFLSSIIQVTNLLHVSPM